VSIADRKRRSTKAIRAQRPWASESIPPVPKQDRIRENGPVDDAAFAAAPKLAIEPFFLKP
jgi:hypothetical protein